MSSTVIKPIAEAITATVDALEGEVSGHTWEPNPGQMEVPCVIVGIPAIRRVGIDEAEPEVGNHAWYLTYPVSICFDLDEALTAADDLANTTEALVRAIDADETLGLTASTSFAIQEAHITNVERPTQSLDTARPLLITDAEIEVLAFVPNP